MASISENNSYKIWQNLDSETWETLYNLVYEDYNGGSRLGIDNKNLEYQIMQVARNLIEADGASFPASWEQFHTFLNEQLKNY